MSDLYEVLDENLPVSLHDDRCGALDANSGECSCGLIDGVIRAVRGEFERRLYKGVLYSKEHILRLVGEP